MFASAIFASALALTCLVLHRHRLPPLPIVGQHAPEGAAVQAPQDGCGLRGRAVERSEVQNRWAGRCSGPGMAVDTWEAASRAVRCGAGRAGEWQGHPTSSRLCSRPTGSLRLENWEAPRHRPPQLPCSPLPTYLHCPDASATRTALEAAAGCERAPPAQWRSPGAGGSARARSAAPSGAAAAAAAAGAWPPGRRRGLVLPGLQLLSGHPWRSSCGGCVQCARRLGDQCNPGRANPCARFSAG